MSNEEAREEDMGGKEGERKERQKEDGREGVEEGMCRGRERFDRL